MTMKRLASIKYGMLLAACWCFVGGGGAASAEELARQAKWQARFSVAPNQGGATVSTVEDGSPLAEMGIRTGDKIVRVNGEHVTDASVWERITTALVADTDYDLVVRRGFKEYRMQVTFPGIERESYDHLKTEYTSLISDYGVRQRVIITRPTNLPAGHKTAGLFIVPGLSCSSVELTPGRDHNWAKMLRALVTDTEMTVLRVEKPGVGDSEGDCGATDFATELNGYELAYQMLRELPEVDQDRVVIYGSSMGSALAPYLANKYGASGIVSDGSFYRSWFEHMLEIERRIKQMEGKSETQITDMITKAYIPLYYGMLVEKKSYDDVIRQNSLLADYNYHGPRHMYGRPVEYYHQVQDFDFAGNWQKLKVPARLRWGQLDWIMSEYDIDMIENTLLSAGNKDVVVEKTPSLDHWHTLHEDVKDSFTGKRGTWSPSTAQIIVEWIKKLAEAR
ncbi:hypothetical protein GCM10017044_19640 [Kordiimonas sediminis]|uniref:PDZ domain-containing protein n=1 Tax=Kordiimonas sediminis TaxID=1735581 RepID=A0A919E910_9PROT|nr:alpha/beta fold hydrolase [Kordiimonas sediminis]GHF24945.1 hypothetical protein GCM10017044_19640 [Kordiimonas sediminis]